MLFSNQNSMWDFMVGLTRKMWQYQARETIVCRIHNNSNNNRKVYSYRIIIIIIIMFALSGRSDLSFNEV